MSLVTFFTGHKCMKKIFPILILIVVFLFPALSIAACKDLTGLYEKRESLRKQFQHEEVRVIDQEYRRIIHDLFFEYERGEHKKFDECYDAYRKDKYLFFVCKLIKFYNDKNADNFLEDIPLSNDGLHPLWELDSISSVDVFYNIPYPQVFKYNSVTDIFIEAICKLATEGNKEALEKLFLLGNSVDGCIAEDWADNIFILVKDYPRVVVSNWEIFRKYKAMISFESTASKNDMDLIIQKYENLCSSTGVNSKYCREIIDFLNNKKAEL